MADVARVQNKTMLGEPVPAPVTSSPSAGTIIVTCPGCGRAIPLEPHELSLTIECARCNIRFVPAATPAPARPPASTPLEPQEDSPAVLALDQAAHRRKRSSGRDDYEGADTYHYGPRSGCASRTSLTVPIVLGFFGAGLGGFGLGCVGLYLSQHRPVFGGFLELNLAEPWSPARINLIPIHLLAFGLIGILLGAVFGFALGLLLRE
jgi:hypothetical protein